MNRSHWSILNNQPINFRSINPYDETRQILLAQKKHRRYKSQPNFKKQKTLTQIQNQTQFSNFGQRSLFFGDNAPSKLKKQNILHKKIKSQEFVYNKWYIKPQFRMHRKIESKIQLTQPEYSYQNLYAEKIMATENPLNIQRNKRIEFAQNFAIKQINSMALLSQFKKRSEKQKKRVPKLVDLIVQFHNKKRKINNFFDQKYR